MRRLWPWALWLLPLAAQGSPPSAGTVLHRVSNRREELQLASLVARGSFTFMGEDAKAVAAALKLPEASEVSAPAVLSYKAGGRCRVELVPGNADASSPAVSNGGGGTVRVSGADVAALKALATYACPLLDPKGNGESLASFLRSVGVDTSRVTYGRLGNLVVAYVIGGRAKDVGLPTFWAEKDRFEPLRLSVPQKGGGVLDVRLVDYSSPICGEWHPRLIEVRRGDQLLGRFAVEKIEPNARVSETLF